jgi:hypothetical protein
LRRGRLYIPWQLAPSNLPFYRATAFPLNAFACPVHSAAVDTHLSDSWELTSDYLLGVLDSTANASDQSGALALVTSHPNPNPNPNPSPARRLDTLTLTLTLHAGLHPNPSPAHRLATLALTLTLGVPP